MKDENNPLELQDSMLFGRLYANRYGLYVAVVCQKCKKVVKIKKKTKFKIGPQRNGNRQIVWVLFTSIAYWAARERGW